MRNYNFKFAATYERKHHEETKQFNSGECVKFPTNTKPASELRPKFSLVKGDLCPAVRVTMLRGLKRWWVYVRNLFIVKRKKIIQFTNLLKSDTRTKVSLPMNGCEKQSFTDKGWICESRIAESTIQFVIATAFYNSAFNVKTPHELARQCGSPYRPHMWDQQAAPINYTR